MGMFIFISIIAIGYLFCKSETGLRVGLWMNVITGKQADDIVRHHYTGKLPGDE